MPAATLVEDRETDAGTMLRDGGLREIGECELKSRIVRGAIERFVTIRDGVELDAPARVIVQAEEADGARGIGLGKLKVHRGTFFNSASYPLHNDALHYSLTSC